MQQLIREKMNLGPFPTKNWPIVEIATPCGHACHGTFESNHFRTNYNWLHPNLNPSVFFKSNSTPSNKLKPCLGDSWECGKPTWGMKAFSGHAKSPLCIQLTFLWWIQAWFVLNKKLPQKGLDDRCWLVVGGGSQLRSFDALILFSKSVNFIMTWSLYLLYAIGIKSVMFTQIKLHPQPPI